MFAEILQPFDVLLTVENVFVSSAETLQYKQIMVFMTPLSVQDMIRPQACHLLDRCSARAKLTCVTKVQAILVRADKLSSLTVGSLIWNLSHWKLEFMLNNAFSLRGVLVPINVGLWFSVR
jgi:hypothetical protein